MPRGQQRLASGVRWLLSEGLARIPLPGIGGSQPGDEVSAARRAVAAATWWGHDPHWYPGGTPPRQHNHVTPLIDGARYFAALREALTRSRSYVYIAGWCLTPDIPLDRSDSAALITTRLLPELAAVARRVPVRVLLWNGAPILYQPAIGYILQAQRRLLRAARGDLECRLDKTARFTHTHHQKAIVIDGQVAFVGGIDLTTLSGDRWDTPAHPLRGGINWHDVQLQIEGEAVADVEANFRERWTAVTGTDALPHRAPVVEPGWSTPVQIARTVPRHVYPSTPRGEFGIHHAYVTAIAKARRLIYLENQYLWSPEILAALKAALRRPHDDPFRVVLVLPAQAGDGRWDNDKHVGELRAADDSRNQLSIYALYSSGPHSGTNAFIYRPIYVHAKVGIFDDEWFTIGSANLNTRGLRTDGEMNAVVHDPSLARQLRVDLWAEHLALPPAQVAAADPLALIDRVWPMQARTNARIMKAGRRPLISAIQRYSSNARPGEWVLEDAQALTFEH